MRMHHSINQILPMSNEDVTFFASSAGATRPFAGASDRYSFVPTLEAVDLLRSDGWVPVDARQSMTRQTERKGFQKHTIRFAKQGLNFSGQERVDLVLINSHDRGSAFQLMASVWRQICGNGLMVSTDLCTFSHRHINFDAEAFVHSAKQISEHAGMIAEQVEDFKAVELRPIEREALASSAHMLIYDEPEKAPIQSPQLLNERRYDDKGNDLWSTFNVVQENIIKGGLCGFTEKGRRTKTRRVKSIDRDIKLNRALWALTEKMADLKAA